MGEAPLHRPAGPLLHGLGAVAELGAQGAHPHLAHLLVPLQQIQAHLHNVPGPLLSGHAQLAQGGLEPAAVHLPLLVGGGGELLLPKHALDGVQVPLILQLLAHVADDLAHLDEVDGLADEEVHPGQIGLGHHLLAAHLGDHDELGRAALLLQLPDHLNAVLLGHEQVHQNQIRGQGQDLLQVGRAAAAVAADGPQLAALHNILQHPDHGGVVLYNVNSHTSPFSKRFIGILISNRAPPPGVLGVSPAPLATWMLPPSSWTINSTAGSPMPRLMFPVLGSNLVE